MCARWLYFYPRSPCGERLSDGITMVEIPRFLSTLSLRRATRRAKDTAGSLAISIHALLAESDRALWGLMCCTSVFLSTLSLRRATLGNPCAGCPAEFLSTLSLRRATRRSGRKAQHREISIHALLAESDQSLETGCGVSLISIHALLAESDLCKRYCRCIKSISIHALLAESDLIPPIVALFVFLFLSTLSLRRATW